MLDKLLATWKLNPADKPESWLPNFLSPRTLLLLACLAQVIVLASLLFPAREWRQVWQQLGPASLLAQWIVLFTACTLTLLTPLLARLRPALGGLVAIVLVACVSYVCVLLVQFSQLMISATPEAKFALAPRVALVAALVAAAALRYAFVQSQWQEQIQAHQRAKIDALTARIRPHFLFNSMNTLASLITVDQRRAEALVVDLSELFRAALRASDQFISLRHELELARHYLEIEALRLGSRLELDWNVSADAELDSLKIPPLILQPLVENAIYHGIAQRAQGGRLGLSVARRERTVVVEIENPLAETESSGGNGMAIANIQARLRLAFGDAARLQLAQTQDKYTATVYFPIQSAAG
jgi:two-component system, LytTR family, sensor histidine kinase AlgZ